MKRFMTAALVLVLSIVACSGEDLEGVASQIGSATDASVADEVEQNAVELATQVEQEMDGLTAEIQSSQSAEELQDAWADIQSAVTEAIASMQTDGTISSEGLADALTRFQTELDAAGDEIKPALREAWDSFKSSLEQMMS